MRVSASLKVVGAILRRGRMVMVMILRLLMILRRLVVTIIINIVCDGYQ